MRHCQTFEEPPSIEEGKMKYRQLLALWKRFILVALSTIAFPRNSLAQAALYHLCMCEVCVAKLENVKGKRDGI